MTEANQLLQAGIIAEDDLQHIRQYEAAKPFSVHWELRTMLYLGILLLTSGIGILVYLNIDSIGHQAVIAAIGLACAGCFYYSFKNRQPYSNGPVKNTSPLFDYIALLACLLFGSFVGYLQFAYHVFGSHLWLASIFPAVLFFYCAYIFDHKGLLALGITGVASTLGLSIAPMQVLNGYNLSGINIVLTAIALGLAIVGVAKYSDHKNIKQHFSFTYHSFAINILFVACLSFLFNQPYKFLSFLFLTGLCVFFVRYAIAQQSLLFLLLATVYSYIGLTYAVFLLMDAVSNSMNEGLIGLGMIYVMASCVGVILFFVNYKKILHLKK